MVAMSRCFVLLFASLWCVGDTAEAATWGEPGYWVKLLDIVPSAGMLSPAFDPDLMSFDLVLPDPDVEAATLTLSLDLSKYNPMYCPQIIVNDEEFEYNPASMIQVPVPLSTMAGASGNVDKRITIKLLDPKSGGGGFLGLGVQPQLEHEYNIHVLKMPFPKDVISATGLMVKNTAEVPVVGEPAFDPDGGDQEIKYMVDAEEYCVHVEMTCPDGYGHTTQYQDGVPVQSGSKFTINLGEDVITRIVLECKFANPDMRWTTAGPMVRKYVLEITKMMRANSRFRSMLVMDTDIGYCEEVQATDTYLLDWVGNRDLVDRGFVCRATQPVVELGSILANEFMSASLIAQGSGQSMDMLLRSKMTNLTLAKDVEYFSLRVSDTTQQVDFPVVLILVAPCTSISSPHHKVLKPADPSQVLAHYCLSNKCSLRDHERCFTVSATCNDFDVSMCPQGQDLRADASSTFCKGETCDAVDTGTCCRLATIVADIQVLFDGQKAVVVDSETAGDGEELYKIVLEATGTTEGDVPRGRLMRVQPPTFEAGEEVSVVGIMAIVTKVFRNGSYEVTFEYNTQDRDVVRGDKMRKSPSFFFKRSRIPGGFGTDDEVVVNGHRAIVRYACGQSLKCEVVWEANQSRSHPIDSSELTHLGGFMEFERVTAQGKEGSVQYACGGHVSCKVTFSEDGSSSGASEAASSLTRLGGFSTGDQVLVGIVEAEVTYGCGEKSGCEVRFTCNDSNVYLPVSRLTRQGGFYQNEVVWVSDRKATVERDCGQSAKCQVTFQDDSSTSARLPPSDLTRMGGFEQDELVKVLQHAARVKYNCGASGRCFVVFGNGSTSGELDGSLLKRAGADTFESGESVLVDGREAIVSFACGGTALCEVIFQADSSSVLLHAGRLRRPGSALSVGMQVVFDGHNAVVLGRCPSSDGSDHEAYDVVFEATDVVANGLPADKLKVVSPPSFREGERVIVQGHEAVVETVMMDDAYRVGIQEDGATTPTTVSAYNMQKSPPYFLKRLRDQGGFSAGESIVVNGKSGVVTQFCGGDSTCKVTFQGSAAAAEVSAADLSRLGGFEAGDTVLHDERAGLIKYNCGGHTSCLVIFRDDGSSFLFGASSLIREDGFDGGEHVFVDGERAVVDYACGGVDKCEVTFLEDGSTSEPLAPPSLIRRGGLQVGERVVVDGRKATIEYECGGIRNCLVTYQDDGSLSEPLQPSTIVRQDGFEADETVFSGRREAVVQRSCGGAVLCEVKFTSDGSSSAPIPPDMLSRQGGFGAGERVTVRGRAGAVDYACGGIKACQVTFDDDGSTSGTLWPREVKWEHGFKQSEKVLVHGRMGTVRYACGGKALCQVVFMADGSTTEPLLASSLTGEKNLKVLEPFTQVIFNGHKAVVLPDSQPSSDTSKTYGIVFESSGATLFGLTASSLWPVQPPTFREGEEVLENRETHAIVCEVGPNNTYVLKYKDDGLGSPPVGTSDLEKYPLFFLNRNGASDDIELNADSVRYEVTFDNGTVQGGIPGSQIESAGVDSAGVVHTFDAGEEAIVRSRPAVKKGVCPPQGPCEVAFSDNGQASGPLTPFEVQVRNENSVMVSDRLGIVKSACGGKVVCQVTFADNGFSSGDLDVSKLRKEGAFEQGEQVLIGSRRGIIMTTCGTSAMCQVTFLDDGSTSVPMARSELKRVVGFIEGEAVVAEGRRGIVASVGSDEDTGESNVRIRFTDEKGGSGSFESSDITRPSTYHKGQRVRFDGHDGLITNTHVHSTYLIKVGEDGSNGPTPGPSADWSHDGVNEQGPTLDDQDQPVGPSGNVEDITDTHSHSGPAYNVTVGVGRPSASQTNQWIHTALNEQAPTMEVDDSPAGTHDITKRNGWVLSRAIHGDGAVMASDVEQYHTFTLGDRVIVDEKAALVSSISEEDTYTVLFQEDSTTAGPLSSKELDYIMAEVLIGDRVLAFGQNGTVAYLSRAHGRSFHVEFDHNGHLSGHLQFKQVQHIVSHFQEGDSVLFNGRLGTIRYYNAELDEYSVAYPDSDSPAALKPYQLRPASGAHVSGAADFQVGDEVIVYGTPGVVRSGPDEQGWYNLTFFEDGLTSYPLPKTALRHAIGGVHAGSLSTSADDAASQGTSASAELRVGDSVLVHGVAGIIISDPDADGLYSVEYGDGSMGQEMVKVGDEVRVRGQKAIVILGPDNRGGFIVRFEKTGSTGGPYKVMELLTLATVPQGTRPEKKLKKLYSREGGRITGTWLPRSGLLTSSFASCVVALAALLLLLSLGVFWSRRDSRPRAHSREQLSRRAFLRYASVERLEPSPFLRQAVLHPSGVQSYR
mmetsp:Transcript_43935/g.139248  ORF Transcript_43935/g.139248 Transcript_43935/m.139248 type:complete len:2305 (+) Transcript_43935:66-6980(+)